MKVGNQGQQVLIEENNVSIEDQDENEVEHESQAKAECENQDKDEYENQNTEEGSEDLKDHLNSSNDGHYEEEVNHVIILCFVLYHHIRSRNLIVLLAYL